MILKELRSHQWKAFKRHPMFERNMALKVFMFFTFGYIGLQLLIFGFLLFDILTKFGMYTTEIESFNYVLLYLLLFDFLLKYLWKQSGSMQIVPYLTMPVKRTTLFNFLLVKEFSNVWNLYFFFMLIPFVFTAIPVYYGYTGVLLYILFFYLLCVGNSLLVNISNIQLNRSGWYLFLPIIIAAAIAGVTFIPCVNIEDSIVNICTFILNGNIIVWMIAALIFAALWAVNLTMMNKEVYRAMQGKSSSVTGSSLSVPFLDKLGKVGTFINLEIKMIMRSKRLKGQMYFAPIFIVLFIFMIDKPHFQSNTFNFLLFTILAISWFGLIMSQYIFTSESSFFDGMMSRNLSMFDILKSKYIFYVSYSVLMLFILMVFVFLGKFDFLYLISSFFYCIGFLYFLMFQNAVYNKSFFDHSESGAFNWKGTSGNMIMVTMIGMFAPVVLVIIINVIFNMIVANYFMLITGFIFTATSKYWLTWTYNRFLKRKYKNMEGFRQ